MLAGNGRAERDNSICRTTMRVSTSNQTLPLSYFALVFPTGIKADVRPLADRSPIIIICPTRCDTLVIRCPRPSPGYPRPRLPAIVFPSFFSWPRVPPLFLFRPSRRSTDYRRTPDHRSGCVARVPGTPPVFFFISPLIRARVFGR